MTRYIDRDDHSGILRYELGDDYIKIEFQNNSIYLYSYSSSGENYIETMKELAISGYGLNSYINKYVKLSYESKLR